MGSFEPAVNLFIFDASTFRRSILSPFVTAAPHLCAASTRWTIHSFKVRVKHFSKKVHFALLNRGPADASASLGRRVVVVGAVGVKLLVFS